MKRNSSIEFFYQLFALILIIISIHAVYVAIIRPRADAILAEQAAGLNEKPSPVLGWLRTLVGAAWDAVVITYPVLVWRNITNIFRTRQSQMAALCHGTAL